MIELLKYNVVDRNGWPNGIWDNEPDIVQFEYTVKGTTYPCLINRNKNGSLCGYVGVFEENVFYGKHNLEYEEYEKIFRSATGNLDINFRGFITQKYCDPYFYTTYTETKKDIFWVGFDCDHYWNCAPGNSDYNTKAYQQYCTIEDVKEKIKCVAIQIHKINDYGVTHKLRQNKEPSIDELTDCDFLWKNCKQLKLVKENELGYRKRCETCVHFNIRDYGDLKYSPHLQYLGNCALVKDANDSCGSDNNSGLYIDDNTYHEILVGPKFGCIHHEGGS